MRPIGLYLHIPYCNGKCPYCDFFSTQFTETEADRYTDALCQRIELAAKNNKRQADTLYLGGGTPSLLGTNRLIRILDTAASAYSMNNAEVTMELNPSSGLRLDFPELKKHGLNRVSIGLQSAVEEELNVLGRKHSAQDASETADQIRKAGIHNISLDLMVGISKQTKESLQKSIDFCAHLQAEHISAYLLKIEPGTVYEKRKTELALPDDDKQSELYLTMCDSLEALGYRQYEISNFSKPRKESRHNLKYWRCEEYLGIGPAAHSFLNGKRFYTPRSFSDFYEGKTKEDGSGGTPEEYIMLALRLCEGVQFRAYEERFQMAFPEKYIRNAMRFEKSGLLSRRKDGLHFTKEGFLLYNTLTAKILWG